MPRNINRRVEVLFPVQDQRLVKELREQVLDVYLADNLRARRMNADGSYTRLKPKGERQAARLAGVADREPRQPPARAVRQRRLSRAATS